jgi:hypothetical protein
MVVVMGELIACTWPAVSGVQVEVRMGASQFFEWTPDRVLIAVPQSVVQMDYGRSPGILESVLTLSGPQDRVAIEPPSTRVPIQPSW